MILTKNPKFALDRDYLLLRGRNVWLGTTLTAMHKIKDEPNSPSNLQRALALDLAHSAGLRTWVSIEPWIPGDTDPLEIIKATHEFVDWYVIGRLDYETHLGYSKIPKGWYRYKMLAVIDMLETLGKPYYLKKQLRENP